MLYNIMQLWIAEGDKYWRILGWKYLLLKTSEVQDTIQTMGPPGMHPPVID
jgi:hypothetical protein